MATASELLNTSDILTIDVKSRTVNIPAGIKALGVESDDDVQKLRFQMPRYYNKIDLSTYVIRINYENAKGEGDVGGGTDVSIGVDTIEFTWLVGRHAFLYKGNVKFVVCLRKMNGSGEITSEFNTTTATLPVLEGLETDEAEIEAEKDVMTTFANEVLAAAKESGEFNPVKGVDYFDEEEKEQLVDEVIQGYNATVANAITDTATGSIVRIEDICPITHSVKCWVHGKNLFDISDYTTEKDYSNGKTIYAISAKNLIIGRTYTVCSDVPMRWFKISNSATGYSSVGISSSTGGFTSYTFVHQRNLNISDSEPLKIYVDNVEETAMNDPAIMSTMNIRIVEGDVEAEYTPYVDPTTITLNCYKRNLFNVGTIDDYHWIGETTVSNNSITGTVTDYNGSHVINLRNKYVPGTYSISFDYADSTAPRMLVRVCDANGEALNTCHELTSNGFYYNDAYKAFYKNGKTHVISIPDSASYWCLGFVFPISANSANGAKRSVYNIRVEYSDAATKQETCEMSSYTPGADGRIDIPSHSPIMTLMTSDKDVVVEATYARDTNDVVELLNKAIADALKNGISLDEYVKKTDIKTYVDSLLSNAVGGTKVSSVELKAANWEGTASPYSQVVSINGTTENSHIELNPTVEQLNIFHEKDITFVPENEDGVITVFCVGQKPTNDYTMQVTITEVVVDE